MVLPSAVTVDGSVGARLKGAQVGHYRPSCRMELSPNAYPLADGLEVWECDDGASCGSADAHAASAAGPSGSPSAGVRADGGDA